MSNTLSADGFTYSAEPSEIVQRLVEYADPKTAIDIGAGAGRNALFLLLDNCAVTAVECGSESLAALRQTHRIYPALMVIDSTLQNLQIDDQFEAVLCNMTLHFLLGHEIPPAIDKLKALTGPGGYVCISVYIDCPENESLPDNYTFKFAPEELRNYFIDWDISYYIEDFPDKSRPTAINTRINGGKGYKSARIIAKKI
jgi:tellurite methyltransferase